MELFVKHILRVLVAKFREDFSFVSQIIDQRFKSGSISIQKDLIVFLFKLVRPRKDLEQLRPWYRLQHTLFRRNVVRPTNVQTENFTINFYPVFDFFLLFLECVLMDFHQPVFFIHFLLQLYVMVFHEPVVNLNLALDLFKDFRFFVELLMHCFNVISESIFNGTHAFSPFSHHFCDAGQSSEYDFLWERL